MVFTKVNSCSDAVARLSVVCRLSVTLVHSPGNPSFRGRVKRKRGSQIQRFWTYRTLYYLRNGARYDIS